MKKNYLPTPVLISTLTRICPTQTKATFAKSYNWLMRRPELSPGAKHIYNRLSQFAGTKNYARVKQSTLALETALSIRQVQRYIAELVAHHLIEVQQLGLTKANLYYFLHHPWREESEKLANSKSSYLIDKHPHNNIPDTTHVALPDTTHVVLPDTTHVALPDTTHVVLPDTTHVALPLNRSEEKTHVVDNTHRSKESVCVCLSAPSQFSLQQWVSYAESQTNVKDAVALAYKLIKSKENDFLLERFLKQQKQLKEHEPNEQALKTLQSQKQLEALMQLQRYEQDLALGEQLYAALSSEEKEKLLQNEWLLIQQSEHFPKYQKMPKDQLLDQLAYLLKKSLVKNYKEPQP